MKKQETYSISQLAQEFDISTRTIRYYEERGLLNPERTPGGTRRSPAGCSLVRPVSCTPQPANKAKLKQK
ncbi:hypothetical protein GCM10010965_13700 [Caldalkalibacillus thermarum]|nr:MerR family DNA-binding transcriptional regulator [Caldalkalibacillus thermarum]GGK22023.1 hypothetical protein GCM10010965_13700 [Caldalkalibacillus thermarum]